MNRVWCLCSLFYTILASNWGSDSKFEDRYNAIQGLIWLTPAACCLCPREKCVPLLPIPPHPSHWHYSTSPSDPFNYSHPNQQLAVASGLCARMAIHFFLAFFFMFFFLCTCHIVSICDLLSCSSVPCYSQGPVSGEAPSVYMIDKNGTLSPRKPGFRVWPNWPLYVFNPLSSHLANKAMLRDHSKVFCLLYLIVATPLYENKLFLVENV